MTDAVYSANLGGLAGADARCQAHAERKAPRHLQGMAERLEHLGLGPTHALHRPLRARQRDANRRELGGADVGHPAEPDRRDGDGRRSSGRASSSTGAAVPVWTATDSTGTRAAGDCAAWSTDAEDAGAVWLGNSRSTTDVWSLWCEGDCTFLAPLFCFEQ